MPVVRSLLIRGMLAGLAAGVVAFAFAYVFGEPPLQLAIDFEEARASGAPPGEEPVGRGTQRTLGLATGTLTLGVALGGGFSLLFAYALGRVPVAGPRATAAVLAAAAFVTLTLVPFTKYPPNPPAVGDPATIDERTLLHLTLIAVGVAALVAALRVRSRVLGRLGPWNASIVAGGVFVGLIALAQLVMPGAGEAPSGFPADVLHRFRLASVGVSAAFWATVGLGFGAWAERVLKQGERHAARPAGA